MKKYLILLISLILVFSSCTPDAGNNVDNESFTVTEVGDAVADAINGSKAVIPNTQGGTAYQMSSRALPSDVSIDEMLLDLMKNDAFVTAYYEVFSSVEEVESISYGFDTLEYGKSYGTMTLSASGVSGVFDAGNGVNIDSISVSFDDGKDVVAITEKDVSIQIGDENFSSKANISMRDTRVYSGATLVSFDYSDSVDMVSGKYSISVSNLVYKDQKVSDVSAVQKYVESQLSISGGGTTEPDDPNPDNPSIPGFATLVDQAAGEVFSALNSTNILSSTTNFSHTLTADITLDVSSEQTETTTGMKSDGHLELLIDQSTSGVLNVSISGKIDLHYNSGSGMSSGIPNGKFGVISLDNFNFSIDMSAEGNPQLIANDDSGYAYTVEETYKDFAGFNDVSFEDTAEDCASFVLAWLNSESGVPGLTDDNVVNTFDFDVEGSFGDYDVVSIKMVTNYDSMINKAEYSGVFTLDAKDSTASQPNLEAIINVDKTSEVTYVIEKLYRGGSNADIDNLSSSTSNAIKTFVETYGDYIGNI